MTNCHLEERTAIRGFHDFLMTQVLPKYVDNLPARTKFLVRGRLRGLGEQSEKTHITRFSGTFLPGSGFQGSGSSLSATTRSLPAVTSSRAHITPGRSGLWQRSLAASACWAIPMSSFFSPLVEQAFHINRGLILTSG